MDYLLGNTHLKWAHILHFHQSLTIVSDYIFGRVAGAERRGGQSPILIKDSAKHSPGVRGERLGCLCIGRPIFDVARACARGAVMRTLGGRMRFASRLRL